VSFTTVERIAPIRIYRSKLFVPGSKTNFFAKAAAGPADCVCLDLEDAVAPADKDAARDNVVAALNEVDFKGKIVTVLGRAAPGVVALMGCFRALLIVGSADVLFKEERQAPVHDTPYRPQSGHRAVLYATSTLSG